MARQRHEVFTADEIPRMTSSQDGDLVRSMLQDLGKDVTIVEFGPWLGAMSEVLAPRGHLHVVDTFVWTEDHDRRVPGLLRPGDSFRSTYETLMQSRGLTSEVHEADFTAFRWSGGRIDLGVIDAPKKPAQLHEALLAIAPGLQNGSRLLIKNANSARYFPMMAYMQALCDRGALRLLAADGEGTCNMAAFEACMSPEEFLVVLDQTPLEHVPRARLVDGALGGLGSLQLGLICELIGADAWTEAYEVIDKMAPSRRILKQWDRRELELANAGADPEQLGWLAEIMSLQHSKGGLPAPPKSFKASGALTRRAFWTNNRGKPWRGRAFQPEILERAFQFGYMTWPNTIKDHVRGGAILDVGCGPGLHGFGFLAAGASSYLGLDPIIEMNEDRVKNLAAKSAKMPFGWTPAELSRMVEPWHVQSAAVEELPHGRIFDLAVMHNVTEHLHDIESVFEAVAMRLKPGGTFLYNHHNFFAWNGHHLPPKVVDAIDMSDPRQAEMVDWGHVEFDPDPEHYIARKLNRISLDDLIAITERYFDIEVKEEKLSRPETGLGRLTDEIRSRYPYLSDRDFETQNLFCVAQVRT